jgi:hypothetical protein
MDPIGFAFEHYDAVGRYRSLDNGEPVDSSGKVSLGGTEQAFNDAVGLANLLASAPEVNDCFSRELFRYMLGRRDLPEEAASLAAVRAALGQSGGDLQELLVAAVQTKAFMLRAPAEGEMLQ